MNTSHVDRPSANWIEKRFKYIAEVTKGRLPASNDFRPSEKDAIPYLTMEYLRSESDEPELVEIGKELVYVDEGDTLLLWDGANAGEFFRAKEGAVSSTVAKVMPHKVDARFLYWACKGQEYFLRSQTIGMGIPHVNSESLANMRIPFPHETAQHVIANYLDRRTAQLDALIAAKQCLLELLAEKRQALITRAVIRGLDLDAPTQDSGVPWLGEIPAHWETERARWLFRERDQRSEDGTEELLTVSHLTGVTLRSEKEVNMFEAETLEGYKLCERGDLVINTLWAWMGAMGVASTRGVVSPAYNVYEPTERLEPSYVDALSRLKVFAQEAVRHSKGVWSSRLRLYPEGFFDICLPVPPLSEQRQIAAFLKDECEKLEDLQTATSRTIALLDERRSALISAAVAGQIAVGNGAEGRLK